MTLRPKLPIQSNDRTKTERDIYSVGRLNREVRQLLDHGMPVVWIEAEISNFSRPGSGHWYFSLKDSDAQVRCAMFRARNALTRFTPVDGQLVLVRAKVGLYEPRGEFQLVVEHIEDSGVGALRREYERLREQLDAEGLFAPEFKRKLPPVPQCIGVITSPTGAAIQDILNILARRFPAVRVLIYATAVQGKAAVPQILEAISLASVRQECDVLIVARGGGSIEDLWAFNDESVARALRAAPMPVVTGIGHEIDFTIADFVADLRAPTPSGAAELVVPDSAAWLNTLNRLAVRFAQSTQRHLQREQQKLDNLQHRLQHSHPGQKLRQGAQRLDELEQRLASVVQLCLSQGRLSAQHLAARLSQSSPVMQLHRLVQRQAAQDSRLHESLARLLNTLRQQLALAGRALHAVSPLATLKRGFAIVTTADGGVLRDASELYPQDIINARLDRGSVRARVIEITPVLPNKI